MRMVKHGSILGNLLLKATLFTPMKTVYAETQVKSHNDSVDWANKIIALAKQELGQEYVRLFGTGKWEVRTYA